MFLPGADSVAEAPWQNTGAFEKIWLTWPSRRLKRLLCRAPGRHHLTRLRSSPMVAPDATQRARLSVMHLRRFKRHW